MKLFLLVCVAGAFASCSYLSFLSKDAEEVEKIIESVEKIDE